MFPYFFYLNYIRDKMVVLLALTLCFFLKSSSYDFMNEGLTAYIKKVSDTPKVKVKAKSSSHICDFIKFDCLSISIRAALEKQWEVVAARKAIIPRKKKHYDLDYLEKYRMIVQADLKREKKKTSIDNEAGALFSSLDIEARLPDGYLPDLTLNRYILNESEASDKGRDMSIVRDVFPLAGESINFNAYIMRSSPLSSWNNIVGLTDSGSHSAPIETIPLPLNTAAAHYVMSLLFLPLFSYFRRIVR